MNEMLEKNEIKIDDFNETLLKIQEENNKSIKEVKETIETNENEMDLTTFVAKNKWQVYKEIANIYTERSKHDNNLKEKYSRLLSVFTSYDYCKIFIYGQSYEIII